MAFLGDFELIKRFIRRESLRPLVRMMLERSGVTANDIDSYDDFRRITPITKEELSRLHTADMPPAAMFDMGRITKQFVSPGPLYNAKGPRYDHYRFHYALRRAGFTRTDIVLNTFAYHLTPAGDMFDEAVEKIGATCIPLGPTDSVKAAETVATFNATAFIGTRTFLMNVLKTAGSAMTLKKAYLIAEKLTTKDREMIESTWGIDVYQGYGTAEAGLIATECPIKSGMHVEVSSVFVEILDPQTREPVEPGEMGELVVTFMSEATPYVRLATGDLSMAKPGMCDCGGSFAVITGIFGRTDGSVKVRGAFIHSWAFNAFFSAKGGHGVLTIETDDAGRDRLLLAASFDDTRELADEFKEYFGLSLNDITTDRSIAESAIRDTRTNYQES